jgi:hypothetical protein
MTYGNPSTRPQVCTRHQESSWYSRLKARQEVRRHDADVIWGLEGQERLDRRNAGPKGPRRLKKYRRL